MLNWAKIWDGARRGGISGYAQALALELASRGHAVSTISSGTTYVPDANGASGRCAARRHPDWMGIRAYEIVNSPVLAPSLLQFREPEAEIASPSLAEAFADVLRVEQPAAVHVQSLEGFSLDCLDVARQAGCRLIYSLHNYHTLCPQVYFMHRHRRLCTDYDGGRSCEGCIECPDPAAERARRAAAYPGEPLPFDAPPPAAPAPRTPTRRPRLGLLRRFRPDPPSSPPPPPGVAADAEPGAIEAADEARGMTLVVRQWAAARAWCQPEHETWRTFDNVADAEPLTNGEPTPYSERRRAMVDALNRCDLVHAVSSFVRDKYVAHGVDAARIRTIHIGTIAHELVAANRELLFDPPPRPASDTRPLRLLFIGVNHWYKGVSMLADALEMLTPEVLCSIELSVFAGGGESIEYRFRRLEPRLAGLRVVHGYEPQDIAWMCGGQDVGVVPSVWWDNGPQTVMEMQACGLPLLGARAGGIPDFIEDGVNGLLFRANDRFDLAGSIVRCVREPGLTERLRRGVRPPKTMAEHASELEPIYRGDVP